MAKLTPSERKLAKKSLGEEKDAVEDYTERLRKTKNPKLRKAFKHALPEEKTHKQLFMEALLNR